MQSIESSTEGVGPRRLAVFCILAMLVGWAMPISVARAALVFPEQAVQIRSTGAVLAATITLTDGPGKAWFEYGTGTNLNLSTAPVTVPTATNLMRLRIPIAGLQPVDLVVLELAALEDGGLDSDGLLDGVREVVVDGVGALEDVLQVGRGGPLQNPVAGREQQAAT